jgi:purine-binding chemotaxis protein CheW
VIDGQRGLALLCRAGAFLCALPLEFVIETMRPLPVTALPGAPSWLQGVSVVRGEPLPVVHAGLLLGESASLPARLLTLRAGDHRVALAVDSVMGVRALTNDVVRDFPALLQSAVPDVVDSIGLLDAELLVVLHAGRLVPDTLWQLLGEMVSA